MTRTKDSKQMRVCMFCGRQAKQIEFDCECFRGPRKPWSSPPKKSAIWRKNEKGWGEYTVAAVAGEKAAAFQRLRRFGLMREMNFPHYRLTKKEKAQELRSLFKYGPAKITDGKIEQTMHAQGFCWSYHPHAWEVSSGDALTPMEVFLNDEKLMKVLDMRAYNGSVNSLTDSEVRKGLKAVTQGVSNFRPTAAWAVYERYCREHATVYDPSMGWGGRLLGAVGCRKVSKYVGCDPSTKTFEGLKQMVADLRRMVPYRFDLASFPHLPPNFEGSLEDFNMQVEMHMLGSEDFRPEQGSVDLAFTSPPYFEGNGIVESYSDEPTQSHIKFPQLDQWLEAFIGQTIRNCYLAFKPGGILALNVSDELAEAVTDQAVKNGFVYVETLRLRLSPMIGGTEYNHCRECQRVTGEANGTDPVVPAFGGKWKKCDKHKYKTEPIFVFKKKP